MITDWAANEAQMIEGIRAYQGAPKKVSRRSAVFIPPKESKPPKPRKRPIPSALTSPRPNPDTVSSWVVLAKVEEHFAVTRDMVISNRRRGNISIARHIAWSIFHDHLGFSCKRISEMFGVHHTSVMHGVKQVLQREDLWKVRTEICKTMNL